MVKIKRVSKAILSLTYSISKLILVMICLAIILLMGSYQYYAYTNNKVNFKKPFNSIEWRKRLQVERDPIRDLPRNSYEGCYMYQDLIKNNLSIGMTQEKVIELLGNPDSWGYYTNPILKRYSYFIGNCIPGPFLNRTNDLILYFDQSLKLIDFEDDIYFTYFGCKIHYNSLKNKNLIEEAYNTAYYAYWNKFYCNKSLNENFKEIDINKAEEECGIKLW